MLVIEVLKQAKEAMEEVVKNMKIGDTVFLDRDGTHGKKPPFL